MMQDVMVDIETLGTGTRAAIVSIGAVKFDLETGELGDEFYQRVDLTCYSLFDEFQVDLETIKWWLQQDDGPRSELTKSGLSIHTALSAFTVYLDAVPDVKVWANGSMFDNRILFDAYEIFQRRRPWHYRNDRDMRTLVDLAERLEIEPMPVEFEGSEHNALDDAKHQARQVCAIYKRMYEVSL